VFSHQLGHSSHDMTNAPGFRDGKIPLKKLFNGKAV
jgi:hypothetical protein